MGHFAAGELGGCILLVVCVIGNEWRGGWAGATDRHDEKVMLLPDRASGFADVNQIAFSSLRRRYALVASAFAPIC